MLLENRVLWGAFASVGDPEATLKTVIDGTSDVVRTSSRRTSSDIQTAQCALTTSVQYTQDGDLLKRCAVPRTSDMYSFEFLCSSFATKERSYYCFLVPFRRMLGGLLSRVRTGLRGRDCVWNRLEIMRTVEHFRVSGRQRSRQKTASTLCGLDLHLLAGNGEQEIIFVGVNPAQNRVFSAVVDQSEGFTLSPLSATFSIAAGNGKRKDEPSYVTIDRSGVINVNAGSSLRYLNDLRDLVRDFEKLNTWSFSIDRPVYKSRNAHKKAILSSISA